MIIMQFAIKTPDRFHRVLSSGPHRTHQRAYLRPAIAAVALACSGFLIGCSANISGTGSGTAEENALIIQQLAGEIYAEIDKLLPPGAPVYVESRGTGPVAQRFLENGYQASLLERGRTVYMVGGEFIETLPDEDREGVLVALSVLELNVAYTYPDPESEHADTKLSRNIKVQVFYKIAAVNDGRVVAVRTVEKAYRDLIMPEDVERVQRPELPFTVGRLQERNRGWRDIVETAAVISAAGTVVYLLFSTRSK